MLRLKKIKAGNLGQKEGNKRCLKSLSPSDPELGVAGWGEEIWDEEDVGMSNSTCLEASTSLSTVISYSSCDFVGRGSVSSTSFSGNYPDTDRWPSWDV